MTREQIADLIRSLNSQAFTPQSMSDSVLVVADVFLESGIPWPPAAADVLKDIVTFHVTPPERRYYLDEEGGGGMHPFAGGVLFAWSSFVQWTKVPWKLFDRLVENARRLQHMFLVGYQSTAVVRRLAHISTNVPFLSQGTNVFRAPHHTVSALGMASEMLFLGRGGLVYLEDMDEFDSKVLDVVLVGLRTREVRIRAGAAWGWEPINPILVVGAGPRVPQIRAHSAHSAKVAELLAQMDVIELPCAYDREGEVLALLEALETACPT